MTSSLLNKALQSAGGHEEFKRKMAQFSEDLAFIEKNRGKLLELYDENWIAVCKSEIVTHSKNYDDVLMQIEQKGLPKEQVVIKFLSSRKVVTLF